MSRPAKICDENLEVEIEIAAHHEAGHIVVAAASGLQLRPEGIMVGRDTNGLACFRKESGDADIYIEAKILASAKLVSRKAAAKIRP